MKTNVLESKARMMGDDLALEAEIVGNRLALEPG